MVKKVCIHGRSEHQKCGGCREMDEMQERIDALEAELAEARAQASADFDEEFVCPECHSYDVSEVAYADDFGSMKCADCGYAGEPGEDFPTARKIKDKLAASEAERDDWERAMRQTCEYACKGEDGTPRDLESLRRVQSPEPDDMRLAVYTVLRDLWGERSRRALGEES